MQKTTDSALLTRSYIVNVTLPFTLHVFSLDFQWSAQVLQYCYRQDSSKSLFLSTAEINPYPHISPSKEECSGISIVI